ANLSPALTDELQLQNVEQGVAIVDVDAGFYASNLGFQRGDVIEEVNGERITKTRDLERLSGTPNRSWRIIILRGGQKISAIYSGGASEPRMAPRPCSRPQASRKTRRPRSPTGLG